MTREGEGGTAGRPERRRDASEASGPGESGNRGQGAGKVGKTLTDSDRAGAAPLPRFFGWVKRLWQTGTLPLGLISLGTIALAAGGYLAVKLILRPGVHIDQAYVGLIAAAAFVDLLFRFAAFGDIQSFGLDLILFSLVFSTGETVFNAIKASGDASYRAPFLLAACFVAANVAYGYYRGKYKDQFREMLQGALPSGEGGYRIARAIVDLKHVDLLGTPFGTREEEESRRIMGLLENCPGSTPSRYDAGFKLPLRFRAFAVFALTVLVVAAFVINTIEYTS